MEFDNIIERIITKMPEIREIDNICVRISETVIFKSSTEDEVKILPIISLFLTTGTETYITQPL